MLTCAYIFCWRTSSTDVRIFRNVRIFPRWRWTWLGDVILMYVIRWRTCSTDVRVLPSYVFSWRTCSIDVRTLSTYVCYRRTCSADVRVLSTYAFYGRTCFHDVRIRDYAFGDFGTTQSKSRIRDNASGAMDSGLRRTFWTLDLMQKIAVDSFSGLSIAPKNYDWLSLYMIVTFE